MTRVDVSLPPAEWASRSQMVQARRAALPGLEREAWLDHRRPTAGAGALALMLVGLVLGGATLAVLDYGDTGEIFLGGALVLASAVAVAAGAVLGLRVWREGRRVVDALVAWEELIDRVPVDGSHVPVADREIQDAESEDERRSISRRNWVRFRARTFLPSHVPRIALAVVMLLPGLACVVGFVRAVVSGDGVPTEAWLALGPGLTLLVFGGVVFGGVQRFNNAIFRRHRRMRREQRLSA